MVKLKRLNRDEVLHAPDIKTEVVEVPEWGGEVVVRSLSIEQANRVVAAGQLPGGKTDPIAFAVATIVEGLEDPALDAGDVVALRARSAGVISRLAQRIAAMSGMQNVSATLEESEKN